MTRIVQATAATGHVYRPPVPAVDDFSPLTFIVLTTVVPSAWDSSAHDHTPRWDQCYLLVYRPTFHGPWTPLRDTYETCVAMSHSPKILFFLFARTLVFSSGPASASKYHRQQDRKICQHRKHSNREEGEWRRRISQQGRLLEEYSKIREYPNW